MGQSGSNQQIKFNYECKHMEQFDFHENFQRFNENKKIKLNSCKGMEATCYGTQRFDSGASALWIFDPTNMGWIKPYIGLIDANKRHPPIWAKNIQTWVANKSALITDRCEFNDKDVQYYGCRYSLSSGFKFKAGSEPQAMNIGGTGNQSLMFMELSNGLLKFGTLPIHKQNSIDQLSEFSLHEAFQIDSNIGYKIFVCIQGQGGNVELFHSASESFDDWHNRELQRFRKQYKEAVEMHEMQQKAKKEQKFAKVAKIKGSVNMNNVQISMEQQQIQKLTTNQKLQQKHNWTTLLTVLIALFSAIGSVALTDSMGLDDQSNGAIAITMSILSLAVGIGKIYLSWSASEAVYSEQNQSFIHSDVDTKFKKLWMSYSLKMKSIAVFIATLTDLMFDFFQGIAAIQSQQYTDNAWIILVISTWIGVGDEVIECFVEIFFMSLQDVQGCEISFCFGFLLWSIAESVMGCYLLSTYNDDLLRLVGVSIEVNLIIFSVLFVILFIYWIRTKK